MSSKENVYYNLKEVDNKSEPVTYEEILADIEAQDSINDFNQDLDKYTALELDYHTNYNVKDLYKIMDYYSLSRRKLRKDNLVQEIIIYENDPANFAIVQRRKKLWFYIKEIKDDKYLSKYLIFD